MRAIFILIMIFICSDIFAQVDCQLRLRVGNMNFTWTGSSAVVTGNVRLRRGVRNNQCSFFRVGFSQGNAGNYNRQMFQGANYLDYNIYKNSTTNISLKTIPDYTTSDENIFIFFQNNNQRVVNVPFEARLPIPNDGRSFLAKGNYRDIITATVTGVFTSTVSETNNFRVRMNIPAEIDISLVNPGDNFDINATSYVMDFGTLTIGENQSVDLKVRSNAGYDVDITSTNGGQLKHLTLNEYVSYQLQVNGGSQSFPGPGSPLNLGSASGVTPDDGVDFNLNFTIGDPANKTAGQYQDTITITATSID